MKYMLMMHAKGLLENPEDMKASMDYMARLCEELYASGELVTTEALTGPGQARIVRGGKDGKPEVTDGPFPESKEFLIGFWLVDCESAERVYEIAQRISSVPGPGGAPANMPIEVRAVMDGSSAGIE